jgi:oligosaccharide repeat unit polymerase
VYGLAAIAFLALLFLTWRFAPSALCPSMIFVGAWTVNILGLALFSGPLYPVGATTLAIFFWGGLWFAMGSIGVHAACTPLQFQPPMLDLRSHQFAKKILSISLVASLLALPFFVRSVVQLASTGTGAFLYSIRQASVEAGTPNLGIGWTENFVVISAFTAMGWLYLYDGSARSRWLLGASLAITVPFNLLTGTKGGLIFLFLSLLFVTAIRHGQLSKRALVVSFAALATAMTVGFMAFNLAAEQLVGTKVLGSLLDTVRIYWLGNLVAFDTLVTNPNMIPAVHSPDRGLLLLANNFGAHFDVPSVHPNFVTVGPGMLTNTYTIYFTYFVAFGWMGTAVAMCSLGAITTYVFRRGFSGSPFWAMVYCLLAGNLVLSFFSERFLIALNPLAKAMLFFGLVFFRSFWDGAKPLLLPSDDDDDD